MAISASLVTAQLRHRPTRYLLLAVGVALAAALPVLARASGELVATRTLVAAIADLPPGDRSIVVSYSGTQDPAAQRADDALVRARLGELTSAPARHEMLFGELADTAGDHYRLGAADHLADAVRVTSGRLPTSCTPTRCEVLLTGPGPAPRIDPSLGVVVVGTGVRTDPLLLTGTFDVSPGTTLLLADGADTAQRLSSLALFPRGSGWVAALDPARIAAEGVPQFVQDTASVQDELKLSPELFVLTAPTDPLGRADARAALSVSRFAVLGGAAAVLVLGLAIVAAAGLRREHTVLVRLLRRRGAPARTVVGVTAGVVASVVVAGAIVGACGSAALAAVLASREPLGPGAAAVASSAVRTAAPFVLALVVLAVVAAIAVLLWPPTASATAWHTVELVALLAIGAGLLAIARGGVDTGTAAGGDPLLAALPVLGCLIGGLLAARLWPVVAGGVSRLLPDAAVASRVALVGALRRPLVVVSTTAFVTAAVASVVFAGAYRATLIDSVADQAAFDVPTTARLLPGSDQVSPLQLLTDGTPAGSTAYPILRDAVSVRAQSLAPQVVDQIPATLLGVDPAVIPTLSRWSRTAGTDDPATAAQALGSDPPAGGIALPAGARRLELPLQSAGGDVTNTVVTAWIRAADDRERAVPLTLADGQYAGTLPDLGPGAELVTVTAQEDPYHAARREHQAGEGGTSLATDTVSLRLAAPRTDGNVAGTWTGWGTAGGPAGDATTLRLDTTLAGSALVARPGLPDRAPLQVLTDPGTAAAASGGRLALSIGGTTVAAAVAGTLPRFPTAGPQFVVADRAALAEVFDDAQPGTGAPREVWLVASDSPALAAALSPAPYDQLQVQVQDQVRDRLAADPVQQGSASLLIAGAVVALLVGGVALVLLVVGARRDDAGELTALEADGVGPRTLRRMLFLRTAYVAVPAVLIGTVTGLVLARATATLVAVTGLGTTPIPPLTLAVGPGWTGTLVGMVVVAALAVAAAAAGTMLRSTWPSRLEEELR